LFDPARLMAEQAAPRLAKKVGLRIKKSRQKPHINNKGGYQVVDDRNNVVAGRDFDMTAKNVIEFLFEGGLIWHRYGKWIDGRAVYFQ
jgi:hypothetical protein